MANDVKSRTEDSSGRQREFRNVRVYAGSPSMLRDPPADAKIRNLEMVNLVNWNGENTEYLSLKLKKEKKSTFAFKWKNVAATENFKHLIAFANREH